jgi:hypothetical protein
MRTLAWRSALRPAFAAASVAWAALLLLAPVIASQPRASQNGARFVVAVYGIASLLCHQLPERSFRVSSVQMPVCARCAGIYFGAAIACIVSAGARSFQPSRGRSPESLALGWRSLGEPRVALAVAVVPTLATLLYEWTTGVMPAHWTRAAAGVPIGAVAAWLVFRHAGVGRSAAPERGEG